MVFFPFPRCLFLGSRGPSFWKVEKSLVSTIGHSFHPSRWSPERWQMIFGAMLAIASDPFQVVYIDIN